MLRTSVITSARSPGESCAPAGPAEFGTAVDLAVPPFGDAAAGDRVGPACATRTEAVVIRASLTSLLSAVADAAGSDTNATTCLHAADTVDAADEPAAPTLAIGPFGVRSESMKNGDAPATAIAATVTTASLLLERMS